MSSSAWRSACSEYLKLTWSKSIEPSATSRAASAGFVMVGSAFSTSTIRFALSSDMVTITKIMESCMRLMRIWNP